MGLDLTGLGSLFDFGSKIIDKVVPDPAERDKAKLELIKAQQSGELDQIKVQLSAILAEAQSPDPWTSRARPSFLYVVYLLILFSIPMGVLTIFSPDSASALTLGFKAWLAAIPDAFIQLFGVVMLGYIGGRSIEKIKGAAK